MSLPEIGAVIAGRYRLEAPLGSGASASVFRAFDGTLVRSVAIKFPFVGAARRRDEFSERFLREARLAAAVDHPNVVRTLDFGASDGRPFMVMELLEGQTLAARIHGPHAPRSGTPTGLDPVEAVEIMLAVLAGLGAVHRAHIVHRDLKPQNVYLAEDGAVLRPKLMDFGVSRVAHGQRQGMRSALTSQDGMIIGTPEYMSPEQARGMREIDVRSDLYAAGVMLFELLTGSLPYAADSMADLLAQISRGGAPSPAERRPGLPSGLNAVVVQAMAHSPEGRFSDARAMANALCSVMGMSPQAAARGTVQSFVRAASAPSSPPRRSVTQLQAMADAPTQGVPPKTPRVPLPPPPRRRPPAKEGFEAVSLAEMADVMEPNRSASVPIAELPGLQSQVARLQDSVGELQLDPSVGVRVRRVAGGELPPAVGVVVPGEGRGVRRRRSRSGSPTGWIFLALVLGVVGYRWWNTEDRKIVLHKARQTVAKVTSKEVAEALPVNDRITIRLQGVPDRAVVVLDGTVQQATELELPADGALHYVEVQQRGMRTWTTSFESVRDQTFAVMLVEDRPARRPRRPR